VGSAPRRSRIIELLSESNASPEFKESSEHHDLLQQRKQLETKVEELRNALDIIKA